MKRETSAASMLNQVGAAEREQGKIFGMVWTVMIHSWLPTSVWACTVESTAYTYKCTPTRAMQ